MSRSGSFKHKCSREERSVPFDESRRATRTFIILPDDLHRYLYECREVKPINTDDLRASLKQEEEIKIYWCKLCHKQRAQVCPYHGPPESAAITTCADSNNNQRLPNAIESFPSEVELCRSSIPLEGYGVCARQYIPTGTWIGPYEGEILRPEEMSPEVDGANMWEVFHEGKLVYFLNGADENKSSWMRYIRCARHKGEQNMFAFQYCGNIYYRTFKDIAPGQEMLVWYDDKYPQHMGIPLEIYETFASAPSEPRSQKEMTAIDPGESVERELPCLYASSAANTQSGPMEAYLNRASVRSSRTPPRLSQQTMRRNVQRGHAGVFPASKGTEAYPRRNLSWSPGHPLNKQRTTCSSVEEELKTEHHAMPSATERSVSWDKSGKQPIPTTEPSLTTKSTPRSSQTAPKTTEDMQSCDEEVDEDGDSSDSSDSSGFFNCGQCGRSFAQRSVLQIHVCPNTPRKPYLCGHCSQSFDHPNELRTHAVTHAGEKPFKCGFCSRSFAGATTLNNHIRTHTGEKPFTCQRCGKTFTQASQLHRHERIPGDCTPNYMHM